MSDRTLVYNTAVTATILALGDPLPYLAEQFSAGRVSTRSLYGDVRDDTRLDRPRCDLRCVRYSGITYRA
ncbi:hypothetical protein ACLI4Z_05800 [Natrialbaceae archaeon A-arb3/5]